MSKRFQSKKNNTKITIADMLNSPIGFSIDDNYRISQKETSGGGSGGNGGGGGGSCCCCCCCGGATDIENY